MLEIIFKVVKKVIMAVFILYALNIFVSTLNIIIPINIISIALVSLLGIPGLCTLIALFLLL